jgi:hypothetical protein
MSAWPFLFAAGKILDYQFLVCPRPFATKDRISAFRRLVSSLAAQPTTAPRQAGVDDPSLKNILVYYLCQPGTVRGEPVADCGHRPVHVVTGIAFDRTDADTADFEVRAREMVIKQTRLLWPRFEGFWGMLTAPPHPEISEPISAENTGRQPPIRREPRRLWGMGHPAMATAAALVVVTGIAVGGMLVGRSSDNGQPAPNPVFTLPAVTIIETDQAHPTEVPVTAMIGKRLNDTDGHGIGKITDLVLDPAGNLTALMVDAPDGGQMVVALRDGNSNRVHTKQILVGGDVVQLKKAWLAAPVTKVETPNSSDGTAEVAGATAPTSKN